MSMHSPKIESELENYAPLADMDLDSGIRRAVLILRRGGVETFESCEGGAGHAFETPTIKFHGNSWAGLKAVAIAMENGLRVRRVQRVWGLIDGAMEGPWWELVLHTTAQNPQA